MAAGTLNYVKLKNLEPDTAYYYTCGDVVRPSCVEVSIMHSGCKFPVTRMLMIGCHYNYDSCEAAENGLQRDADIQDSTTQGPISHY
jgi:hypothetical protein